MLPLRWPVVLSRILIDASHLPGGRRELAISGYRAATAGALAPVVDVGSGDNWDEAHWQLTEEAVTYRRLLVDNELR